MHCKGIVFLIRLLVRFTNFRFSRIILCSMAVSYYFADSFISKIVFVTESQVNIHDGQCSEELFEIPDDGTVAVLSCSHRYISVITVQR